MRILAWAWIQAALALFYDYDYERPTSFFYGEPEGYGIPFPAELVFHLSGDNFGSILCCGHSAEIRIANSNVDSARWRSIPRNSTGDLPDYVSTRYEDDTGAMSIVINTTAAAFRAVFNDMITTPGFIRCGIPHLEDYFEYHDINPLFGFSTLQPPRLLARTNTSFVSGGRGLWPQKIFVSFDQPISIKEPRLIKFVVDGKSVPLDFGTRLIEVDRSSSESRSLLSLSSLASEDVLRSSAGAMREKDVMVLDGPRRSLLSRPRPIHHAPWKCSDSDDYDYDYCPIHARGDTLEIDNLKLARFSKKRYSVWSGYGIHDSVLGRVFDLFGNVSLVIEEGALVDKFSRSTHTQRTTLSFLVNQTEPPVLVRANPRNTSVTNNLPAWINFTFDEAVEWRCQNSFRNLFITHAMLNNGQPMAPADTCKTVYSPNRYTSIFQNPPSLSPTQQPTSTNRPTYAPTSPTQYPTFSPTTPGPTYSPQTDGPTGKPTGPTPQVTSSPTTSPTPLPVETEYCSDSRGVCPLPGYFLLVENDDNTTTLAINTQHPRFVRDFRGLGKQQGRVSVSLANGLRGVTSRTVVAPLNFSFFVRNNTRIGNQAIGVDGTQGVYVLAGGVQFFAPPTVGGGGSDGQFEITIVDPPPGIRKPDAPVIRVLYTVNDEVTHLDGINPPIVLTFPIKQTIPITWDSSYDPCDKRGTECVYLDMGLYDWSDRGCMVAQQTNGTVACGCSHLTDFTVLLNSDECQVTDPMPYYVMSPLFFCVSLYCLRGMFLLFPVRHSKTTGAPTLLWQHGFIFIAAFFRALQFLAVTTHAPVGAAVVLFGLPYLAKFPAFLQLVLGWVSIAHFVMQPAQQRKIIPPLFATTTIVCEIATLIVFIYFAAEQSVGAAIGGTLTLGILCFLYSITFFVYAFLVSRSFPNTSATKTGGCGLPEKIKIAGVIFGSCFALQALLHPLALFQQLSNANVLWITASTYVCLVADFISLVCLVYLFYPALKKSTSQEAQLKVQGKSSRNLDSSRSAELQKTGTQSNLHGTSSSDFSVSERPSERPSEIPSHI